MLDVVCQQAGWAHLSVQCNKLQECPLTSQDSSFTSTQEAGNACEYGLMITDAVVPGDTLVSIPRQAVVAVDEPDQITLHFACLALGQPGIWHSGLPLYTVQPPAVSEQTTEQIKAADVAYQQHSAGGISQEVMSRCLAASWLSSGRVVLTLPASLLLAQLWPDCESSQAACRQSEALAGV